MSSLLARLFRFRTRVAAPPQAAARAETISLFAPHLAPAPRAIIPPAQALFATLRTGRDNVLVAGEERIGMAACPAPGEALIAMFPDANRQLCFLMAQDLRVISVQSDGMRGPAVSAYRLQSENAALIRLRHPLSPQRYVAVTGQGQGAPDGCVIFDGIGRSRLDLFEPLPIEAGSLPKPFLQAAAEICAAVGRPCRAAALDAPALADWLAPVAPAVFAVLPPLPPQMDMKGSLRLHGATAAFTDLSGHIGAGAVTGSLALIQGERPSVTATLATDRLDIASSPAWPGWWAASQNLAALAAPFAGFDATFDITAASLTLGDRALARVALQGQGTAEALTVTRLQADLPGAHVEASGTVAQDGTVADARLDLAAADAGALKLPVKLPAGLWKGPLHIALTAAGPPQAVTGQLRGDLGDLRAEAEAHFNAQAPLLAATVTLRHPGAPRLLEQAGLSDAGAWVGQGSLAFLAHLTAAPGQIVANDVSLAAGTLRLGGQLGIDLAGADPVISGRLDAPMLTLPALAIPMDASPPLWLLQGWQGQIVISAGQILSGLNNLAANAGATLTVAFGGALLDGIALDIAGGHFTGQAAIDAAAALPQLTMRGTLAKALTGDLPALPGLTWQDGTVDLQADLAAAGHTPGTWLATLTGGGHAALTGAALQGIDLPTLTRLLTTHAAHLRTALPAALATGQTGPLSGDITATLDNGALTMSAATLTGPSGSLILSGSIDLPGHAPDLLLRALPAVPQPPDLAVRIVDGRRVTNAQPGLVWAGKNK